MEIELLVNNYGRMIGLGRYAQSLIEALSSIGLKISIIAPAYPWWINISHALLSRYNLDVKTFVTTYPITARFSKSALKHLTAQQMASLLWLYPRMHPTVVTVHDILPNLMKRDEEQDTFRHPFDRFFDQKAMKSLKKADAIISVSESTKKTLLENMGCLEERIFVIREGVDNTLFSVKDLPSAFFRRYKLDRHGIYLLYVGSDNPRKNLPRLIQAFANVHKQLPEIRLIKLGTSENSPNAKMHMQIIHRLGLQNSVHWLGQVPEGDLPLFYNLARCLIFPSLYEGFGLPVLEAMSCGTPVVTSKTTSLPEVAGEAALLVDPYNVDEIAAAMRRVLEDPALAQLLRQKGVERAKQFSWEKTARETIAVYEKVLGETLQ